MLVEAMEESLLAIQYKNERMKHDIIFGELTFFQV